MLYGELQAAVGQLRYKPGWRFWLHSGPTFASSASTDTAPASTSTAGFGVLIPPVFLVISVRTKDSGGGGPVTIEHRFAVPPEELPFPACRWLLDRVLDVERHEACEFFEVGGHRPFYPGHGPSADLYGITERSNPALEASC